MHALPNCCAICVALDVTDLAPFDWPLKQRAGLQSKLYKHAHILMKLLLDLLACAGVALCQCCRQPLCLNKQDRQRLHES